MTLLRARWPWFAAAFLGLAVFVVVWFEPQALFIDERVSDPVPVVAEAQEEARADDAPTATSTTVPAGPVDLAGGDLVSLDHGTSGRVRVLQLADGSRYVRLEGLRTENGPALRVYLSANPADGPEGAFDDEYVDLGELQGNLGDQNYLIPVDTEPLAYASVVIWCERFDSAFGAADLLAS
jgi:hypothetical protein